MRSIWKLLQEVGGLALLVVFAVVLVVVFRSVSNAYQAPGSAVPSATVCVPTPLSPTLPPGPATATPDRAHFGTVPPPQPTLTPYPISKTTDLSPNVAMDDKGKVLVYHCDGTYELFLTADPAKAVPLQPGDVVVYRALPISALKLQAPTMAGPWPTSTALASPAPVVIPVTPTRQPYPGPTANAPSNSEVGQLPYTGHWRKRISLA